MRTWNCVGAIWICVIGSVWLLTAGGGRAAEPPGIAAEGQQLFEREFAAGDLARSGDGLGPMFNHRSCAACHLQGRLGGGGPVDVNVVILSAELAQNCGRPEQSKLLAELRLAHASFVTDGAITPNVVLHRFGLNPNYAKLRAGFVSPAIPLTPTADERRAIQQTLARDARHSSQTSPLNLVLTQRNTTALFGAGLIDSVPDAVLHALAAEQQKLGEVSGRVPPVGVDGVGRFGWRGQTQRLHDFVLGACANELGLEVPGHEQPRDPLRPTYRPVGLDLTEAQCASLTAYVSRLPTPRLLLPQDTDRREAAGRGRALFTTVGCGACHVERIGPVHGIYSDLLLHDLGAALNDPVLAEPTLVATGKRLSAADELLLNGNESGKWQNVSVPPRPARPRGYSGGSHNQLVEAPSTILIVDPRTRERVEFQAQPSPLETEWRTPPLWGLADSAPYLHDGRAATVVEAIALHGGESEACTKRFFALPLADRLALLEFLGCLRAPE